jgi:hypothetical protein
VKLIRYCIFAVALLIFVTPLLHAQSAGFYIGGGSSFVKSKDAGYPSLNGFFLGFGGDAMVDKHFGIGAEISFQPTKRDYVALQYKQMFYDFNGIYAPVNEKKVSLKLMGGIGGTRTSFSYNDTSCYYGSAVCTKSNISVANSNHFQLHTGAAVEIMLTNSLMVRPQFDFRFVPNFSDQFSRDIVPGGMIWVGFKVKN